MKRIEKCADSMRTVNDPHAVVVGLRAPHTKAVTLSHGRVSSSHGTLTTSPRAFSILAMGAWPLITANAVGE